MHRHCCKEGNAEFGVLSLNDPFLLQSEMERSVHVSDLPRGFSKQSLEDKLMIHFLRTKNGGGEIIDVVFPSETLSSALIIFEEAEGRLQNEIPEIKGMKMPAIL